MNNFAKFLQCSIIQSVSQSDGAYFAMDIIPFPLRIIIFRKCIIEKIDTKLNKSATIIKIILFHYNTLYDNVLQNVRNYSGSESMDASRNFCKWGQVLINKKKPPMEKMAPIRRKRHSTWRKMPL